MSGWYIARDRKKQGPYSVAQMQEMAKAGQLLPTDMVLQDSSTKWTPASQVGEFFVASGSTPPPLSPPIIPESAEWYFTKQGQQAGPVTWTQLRQQATSGQLLATDMVWKNGMAAWAAASTVSGLIPTQVIAAPPPLPPVPVTAVPPMLSATPTANRVTGEVNLRGRFMQGSIPLHLLVDNDEIAVSSFQDGIEHALFESSVGHHSLTIKKEAYLREVGYRQEEVGEETKSFQVEFKNVGHYTITFTFSFMRQFPTGIEVSHAPKAMETVIVPPVRKNALVGLWREITDSGLSFIFTHDGAMIRDDGFGTKFRWLNKDKIELYVDGSDITATYQILSLGRHELILTIGHQSCHFKRGITITEAATEAQRKEAEAEFKRREEEARRKRAETAATFAKVAGGVAVILAAGGFAILCGTAAAASAASGGDSSSFGGDGGQSEPKATPSSSGSRVTGPTPPQSPPARQHQVAALCGAVIVGVDSDGLTFRYKKKCDCGYVDPGTVQAATSNSNISSSFLCSKCKKMQEIRIQGS